MLDLRIDGGLVARLNGEPRVESVGVRDGAVVAIGDVLDLPARRVIDADGLYVLPGAIDTHVHLGFTDRDLEWETETRLAALGGVTTPLIYFRSTDAYWKPLAEFIDAGERDAFVDFGVHMGVLHDDHLAEFDRLVDHFDLRSIKMYTTYKDGELARFGVVGQDDGFIIDVMRKAAARGDVVVNVHCENDDIAKRGERFWAQPDASPAARWSQMRPPVAEVEAIRRIGLFARETGARVHVPHVSSARALQAAVDERALGAMLSIESCPQYLLPQEAGTRGALAKVNPPIRVDESGEAMWEALRDGALDTLGTDHACWCRADKSGDSITDARPGFPGLGTLVPIVMDNVLSGRIRLSDYVRANARAAEIFDLPGRGQVTPGQRADLVLVDPAAERTVDAAKLGGTSDFSPFEGLRLRGWPVMTVLHGQVIAENGELTLPASGRYVRPRYRRKPN
jgi:dihydroorotase (multifunctional complex type)